MVSYKANLFGYVVFLETEQDVRSKSRLATRA